MRWSLAILSALAAALSLALGVAPVVKDASLSLPARAISAKGSNQWNDDVLEITHGRGSTLGWYVHAEREEDVAVWVEYSCAAPLNQAYQLSMDGEDAFWEVPPTREGEWSEALLGTFRLRAGVPVWVQLVPPTGRKYGHPVRLRRLILRGKTPGNLTLRAAPEEPPAAVATPGFGKKLAALHPALALRDLAVDGVVLRVTGMALRTPDELILTTWEGDVFAVTLTAMSEIRRPTLRKIAQGLSEPMGLAVSRGRIFVTEKNAVTELIDADGDGQFETYRCVSHDWPSTLDYHEYLFGAVVQEPYLYFCASVAMSYRSADNMQAPLRGSALRVHLETGATELIAGGLRSPDGVGVASDGAVLITDNQGEWLPANKLIHLQAGAFYNFRSRPPWHPLDRPKSTPPAVWLPQGEIAASPTQPITLPASWGPYAGHVIFGDATYGGLQRAFLEEVDGVRQGAAFHFSQGMRHMLHRFVLTPSGELYGGGIARGRDWDFIKNASGLLHIRYTGAPVFEPLAARLMTNGLELEFTRPLRVGSGWSPSAYHVTQWAYQATQSYGGPKIRHRQADVRSATVSADRRRVLLELPSIVTGEVVHVRLPESMAAEDGQQLWAGDVWYTINRIPADRQGVVRAPPPEVTKDTGPRLASLRTAASGETLFQTFCAACHSLDGTKLVGPSLRGLASSRRTVRENGRGAPRTVVADLAYVRESILDPNALLVDGYQEGLMPALGAALTDAQVEALAHYVLQATPAK